MTWHCCPTIINCNAQTPKCHLGFCGVLVAMILIMFHFWVKGLHHSLVICSWASFNRCIIKIIIQSNNFQPVRKVAEICQELQSYLQIYSIYFTEIFFYLFKTFSTSIRYSLNFCWKCAQAPKDWELLWRRGGEIKDRVMSRHWSEPTVQYISPKSEISKVSVAACCSDLHRDLMSCLKAMSGLWAVELWYKPSFIASEKKHCPLGSGSNSHLAFPL